MEQYFQIINQNVALRGTKQNKAAGEDYVGTGDLNWTDTFCKCKKKKKKTKNTKAALK